MQELRQLRLQYVLIMLLVASPIALLPLAGCGGDDSPVKPNIIDDNQGEIPKIPELGNPLSDPPSRSETLVVLKPASDYCPEILDAQGDIAVNGYAEYASLSGAWIPCFGDEKPNIYVGSAWLSQLPNQNVTFGGCGMLSNYTANSLEIATTTIPSDRRIVLLSGNTPVGAPLQISWVTRSPEICRERDPIFHSCTSKVWIQLQYKLDGKPLTEMPYLRRARFWQSVPWESGNHVERITGAGSIEGTSSYTHGSSTSETESMAYTLGAEIGAAGEVLSAAVSASLTKTFSTTVTVSESETQSFSRILEGSTGKRTCFVLWILYEQYSFANADGTPFTDPNYVFDPGTQDLGSSRYYDLQIAGGQAEATAYVFDVASGKLEQMKLVD